MPWNLRMPWYYRRALPTVGQKNDANLSLPPYWRVTDCPSCSPDRSYRSPAPKEWAESARSSRASAANLFLWNDQGAESAGHTPPGTARPRRSQESGSSPQNTRTSLPATNPACLRAVKTETPPESAAERAIRYSLRRRTAHTGKRPGTRALFAPPAHQTLYYWAYKRRQAPGRKTDWPGSGQRYNRPWSKRPEAGLASGWVAARAERRPYHARWYIHARQRQYTRRHHSGART